MTHEHDHRHDGEPVRSIAQNDDDCRLECLFWLIGLAGVIAMLVLLVVGR